MATSNNSSVTLIARGNIRPNTIAVGGGKGGVSNYELLTHKPSINGHELIGNKTNAELGIPTDTQDLTNTAGFITKLVDDLVNYYTKLEIDDIINQIKQSSFRIVDDLPLVGDPGVIYLILNSTPQSRNYYDEYIYIDSRWEKIGTTEIDLSGYVTDEELTQVLRNYITNETLNETLRNYYNKADVNLLLAGKVNSADLAAVATSGSYNDLQNKPDIPDDLADLNEDTTHRTVTDAEKIAWNNKSDFSGSYNDLTDKPTIPDELADLTDDTTHRLVTDTEKSTWNAKSDFSGSYNDLTDKPDIPTVYNSTITIQKNNQNIDSFTLNQSSNKSINMSVPEKTSDIQNDSGFITNTVNNLAHYYLKSETYTKTEVSNLINAAVSGRFQKVNALPAQGEANVIYLVPKATVLVDNVYDEYIWEDNSWELIGDTQIDLSGYVTDADLTAALQNYVTSATFNTTISNYYTKTEVSNLLADKVDKVDGKGLSTYDYDAAAKAIVDSTTANLATKVDKVDGKGLSSNDYTTADKNKLAGIAAGAEVNVQSDWSQTNTSSDDFIKNKPTKVSQFANDSGFTKVESSETNGNIKIDTVETVVYDDAEIQEVIDTSLTETDYANPLSLETMQAQTAKNTKVKLEPIQDLHGYDKPWVGGAGKNLLRMSIDSIKSSNTSGTWNGNVYTINNVTITLLTDLDNNIIGIKVNGTPSSNVNFVLSVYDKYLANGDYKLNGCPVGGSTSGTTFYLGFYIQGRSVYNFGNGDTNVSIDGTETTGANVFIHAHANYNCQNLIFYPMLRLSTVTDSTFEPYTNICPISGHDEIDILGCGKNLIKNTATSGTRNGITFTVNSDGTIIANGTATANAYFDISNTQLPNGNYILNGNPSGLGNKAYLYALPNYEQRIINHEVTKVTIYVASGYTLNNAVFKPMIRLASVTDDTYEPYTESNNKTIVLPDTVYGGELDLESGELVVDWKSVDLGTLNWSSYSSRFQVGLTGRKYDSNRYRAIFPNYSFFNGTPNNAPDKSYTASIDNEMVYIKDSSYNDANTLKESLSGSIAIYELATPTTIQLTPSQLYLLKAQNNLTTSQYTQVKVIYRNGVFALLDPVTETTDGLMSAMDKLKLDNIVPATTTADGLMTATDKTKLDGVATNATKTESSTTNGNIKINGTETQVYDDSEIKGELTTDTTTIEGNPLNFTTLSAQTAKSTILSLEPIQDLHGYSKPWVGGAGKNKLTLTVDYLKSINTSGTWSGNVFTPSGQTMTFTILTDSDNNVIGIKVNGQPSANITFSLMRNDGLKDALLDSTAYILNGCSNGSDSTYFIYAYHLNNSVGGITLTNGDASFTWLDSSTDSNVTIQIKSGYNAQNIMFYPMIRLSTESDATFAPYTNECSISGRTEIGILGCGRNMLNLPAVSYSGSCTVVTNTDGSISITTDGSTRYPLWLLTGLLKAGTYTFKTYSGSQNAYVQLTGDTDYSHNITAGNSFTFDYDGSSYLRILLSVAANTTATYKLQLEKGSFANNFEGYKESTDLTISLGQTVYGGTLDVENGVLVVDRKTITLNGSENGWSSVGGSYPQAYKLANYTIAPDGDSTFGKFLLNFTNKYPKITMEQFDPDYGMRFSANNSSILYVYDARYQNDLSSFLADLGVNNIQFCYYLATPITINLTPNTINLLKGVNNISVDDANATINLTYRDGSVATLGDLTSAVDSLDSKIDDSKILTDTATGDKYILVVTNGVLSVEQISN